MSGLLLGPGSITEAQLVAFSAAGAVMLLLLSINVAVCRLYRRARTEDERQARRARKKKMSDVWVYHVHRSGVSPAPRDSPSQQILRKLRASHENLRATLAAAGQDQGQGTLGQEESQVLEELEVTADLFLHDTSRASSRCSSLSDPEAATALRDLELETASALHDLDTASAVRELDKSSLYSVSVADFENDPEELLGAGAGGGKAGERAGGGAAGIGTAGSPPCPWPSSTTRPSTLPSPPPPWRESRTWNFDQFCSDQRSSDHGSFDLVGGEESPGRGTLTTKDRVLITDSSHASGSGFPCLT